MLSTRPHGYLRKHCAARRNHGFIARAANRRRDVGPRAQRIETLAQSGDARHFVLEAFRHPKAIAAPGAGKDVSSAAHLPADADGVSISDDGKLDAVLKPFIETLGQHRVWLRRRLAESVHA